MADDHSESIAVVYPSSWPADDPEAHCTVIYLGKIPDVDFTKEDVQGALDLAKLEAPGEVRTKELEMFGPDKDIPVVRLDTTEQLYFQFLIFEAILLTSGIENASEFKDYKPHVTVSSPDIEIPETVTLSAPVLWWGPR